MTNMPSSLTIALAQLQPRKGDFAANLARLGPLFARVDSLTPRPDVVHFPESALTGYFVEGGVQDLARAAGTVARDIDAVYRESVPTAIAAGRTLDVVIGFYERWQSTLHNSVLYATLVLPALFVPQVWATLSSIQAIRHAHRTTPGRAATAVLVPTLACMFAMLTALKLLAPLALAVKP